jgi:hypothetical protein
LQENVELQQQILTRPIVSSAEFEAKTRRMMQERIQKSADKYGSKNKSNRS